MKQLVEIKNLKIESQNIKIINSISFSIYEGVNTFLCGTPGCGKTMLLKAIADMVKYRGQIKTFAPTQVVLDDTDFTKETILEELDYENLNESSKKIVDKFITKSNLKKRVVEADVPVLKLVLLCKAFIRCPKVLFVDNVFSYLDGKTRQKVLTYVTKNKITLVNVSTAIEEALSYDYMFVLDKGRVAMEGKTLQVLEQEKILKRLGIGLPFYVDLSLQLRLYGLVDNIYLNKEDLVGAIWK